MRVSNYKDIHKSNYDRLENSLKKQKRKQPGVAFPSATRQEHLLIIRFNISHIDRTLVRRGLHRLCKFLDRVDRGNVKVNDLKENGEIRLVPLSEFNFTATLGFGLGFFEKLQIDSRNCPRKLKEMPDHVYLGDHSKYTLFQTDFMIQLGSSVEDVNHWVFQHATDSAHDSQNVSAHIRLSRDTFYDEDEEIYSIIEDWAAVTDIHSGFQRIDGRNLLGFNDGISNPKRLSNDTVWITIGDEDRKFTDGTYMVFQKIEHDLERWRRLTLEKQERWIGRRKGTGLLLGTLPVDLDHKLASELHSENRMVRERARRLWKKLYDVQKDPDRRFFDINQPQYRNIQIECPVWSHVRKSNPRQADGAARSLIFRRGYLFAESSVNGESRSGLLFICFQRDIEKGFENIKKNFLNNKDFPVPGKRRNFNKREVALRTQHSHFPEFQQSQQMAEQYHSHYSKVNLSSDPSAQNTGTDGLSGPSELGIFPDGQFSVTTTLGGGYYFIPPIPDRKISDISEQFFA